MESAPRTHATRRSRLQTVVATEVMVVAEAEAEEATAAGVAQAKWARPYQLLPPTPLCVEGGGMKVCHARTRGRFEGDGSNGVCLPTSSGHLTH